MDRIELASSSNDRRSQAFLSPEQAYSHTSSSPSRRRASSLRSRPSIRIQRSSSIGRPSNNSNNPFQTDGNWGNNNGVNNVGGDNSNRNSNRVSDNVNDGNNGSSTSGSTPSPNGLSFQNRGQNQQAESDHEEVHEQSWQGSRRRSSSEPRPGRWSTPPAVVIASDPQERDSAFMPTLTEEVSNANPKPDRPAGGQPGLLTPPPTAAGNGSFRRLRRASGAAINRFSRNRASTVSGASQGPPDYRSSECDPLLVDVLDVIDPEVSTLSTLTNVQNSLFVPDLGRFVNRNPTYTLSRDSDEESLAHINTTDSEDQSEEARLRKHASLFEQEHPFGTDLSFALEDPQFAVLPEGNHLEGWSKEDLMELNDHVRHMLHSRRSKFKQSMKGFGKYVSKPLGFLVTLYATLITLFGLAWVLFLIGWIYVGKRQLYIINVIDNVLVALFAIMGDGLAPFRAVDTYHMAFIAHYTFKTWKIRKERALPNLKNKNDIPWRREGDVDVENGIVENDEVHEFSVLSPAQQLRLMHHQEKFAKSHTFYKPHETFTHYAFSLRILMAIVILLDMHSCFQIALGTCTWSIDYRVRPMALTTTILCCSIVCNISGGVLISIGDRRSRKKDVVERLFRQQLTSEAIKKIEKRKKKEEQRGSSLDIRRGTSLDTKRNFSLDIKRKTSLDIAKTRSHA